MDKIFNSYEIAKEEYFTKEHGIDTKKETFFIKENDNFLTKGIVIEPPHLFLILFLIISPLFFFTGRDTGEVLVPFIVYSFIFVLTIGGIWACSRDKLMFDKEEDADKHIQRLIKIKQGKYERENHSNKGITTVKEYRIKKD